VSTTTTTIELAGHVIATLRAHEAELRQAGIRRLSLFGSVARGDMSSNSDVDLLVRFEPGRSLIDHGGLIGDLEDLLGTKVDVVSEGGLRERIRDRIMKEAVPV